MFGMKLFFNISNYFTILYWFCLEWISVWFYMRACSVASVLSDSLRSHGLCFTRLLYSWDSPGKNTGLGCHTLLQGIFPTQGLNLGLLSLLHCRWVFFLFFLFFKPLAPPGKPMTQSSFSQRQVVWWGGSLTICRLEGSLSGHTVSNRT